MLKTLKTTKPHFKARQAGLGFGFIDLFASLFSRKEFVMGSVNDFKIEAYKAPRHYIKRYIMSKREKLALIKMGRWRGAHGKSKREQAVAWAGAGE